MCLVGYDLKMLVILGVGWATPACQCQECESSKRSSSSFSSRFKYWPRLERICLLFHQTCVGVGARFCSTLGLLGSWSFKQNSAEADLVRSCERGWQMSQLFEQKWCHLPFSFSTPLRFFLFKKNILVRVEFLQFSQRTSSPGSVKFLITFLRAHPPRSF